jgi:hypothetical protein
MMQWIKRWGIPVVLLLVLLSALGFQGVSALQTVPEPTLERPLAELIPQQMYGWEVTDMDLGPTESVTQRSHDLLKLDDFVHRQYERGDKHFTVYIAYWKPGKMPVRLVNQHTPDRCWTEVGFVCNNREWNVERSVKGQQLQPGQWGEYELNGNVIYTYFWHIVGGEAHWYGGNRMNVRTSLTTVMEDITKFGMNVHREQYFVRITSPRPMDELWDEPGYLTVMEHLAALCLAEPESPAAVAAK